MLPTLGWAPCLVNYEQQPCCTHTIHSPLVRGINCEGQALGCVEREMRMTPNYWLYLLCGHWACGARMGGFSEEGRGLSFSVIGGLRHWRNDQRVVRSSQLQLRPLAVFPEVHYSAFKGESMRWQIDVDSNPFYLLCCCMHAWMLLKVCVSVWMCVHVSLASIYKCAALSIYDNWMLWSICVLVVYFLLVALMACYRSKPVFKRFLMGIHMHHPSDAQCRFVSISH